jgi:hypothetical protein
MGEPSAPTNFGLWRILRDGVDFENGRAAAGRENPQNLVAFVINARHFVRQFINSKVFCM